MAHRPVRPWKRGIQPVVLWLPTLEEGEGFRGR